MRSLDTTPEAHEVQMNIFRAMSPGRRMELGMEISEFANELAAAGIRARHPDYDEQKVRWALFRVRLGDSLFREVWPQAPLLRP